MTFTLLDPAISNEQLFSWFTESFVSVREKANIPLSVQANHEHQDGGFEVLRWRTLSLLAPRAEDDASFEDEAEEARAEAA